MIEIFKHDNKWRIKVVNETLECDTVEEMKEVLNGLLEIKIELEPYKKYSN